MFIWAFCTPRPAPVAFLHWKVTSKERNHPQGTQEAIPQKTNGGSAPSSLRISPSAQAAPSMEPPSSGNASADYALEVRKKIESLLNYPLSLKRRQIQGRVLIKLIIDSSGNLDSNEIVESSGYRELDELALEAISQAAPFPRFNPGGLPKTRLELHLPFQFELIPKTLMQF